MGLLAPKGIFHIKWTGLLVLNFEKNPYQDPASWAWLEMYFTPKMYQFLTNTFLLSHFFFGLLKAPAVDLLRHNTQIDTKTGFFYP